MSCWNIDIGDSEGGTYGKTSYNLCCPKVGTNNNSLSFDCDSNGSCKIDISYQNRKLSCSSSKNLINCLNSPSETSISNIPTEYTIPWLIRPKELYYTLRNIVSACADKDDKNCLPYANVYKSNSSDNTDGTCSTGNTVNKACSSTVNNTNKFSDNCNLYCPSKSDQEYIGIDTPCDHVYYSLCESAGCTPDTACSSLPTWTAILRGPKIGVLVPNDGPRIKLM